MKKWYIGKNANDIVVEMSRVAHESVANAKQGNMQLSEDLYDTFVKKFGEVIPAIVDIKTEFYMHNKDVWSEWDKCQRDLWTIKNGMIDDLTPIYNK